MLTLLYMYTVHVCYMYSSSSVNLLHVWATIPTCLRILRLFVNKCLSGDGGGGDDVSLIRQSNWTIDP